MKAFLEKWLSLAEVFPFDKPARKGNFLLSYNDLARGGEVLQSLGIKTKNIQKLPRFHSRSSDVTQRKSQRVSDLLQTQTNILGEIDDMIMESFPSLSALI